MPLIQRAILQETIFTEKCAHASRFFLAANSPCLYRTQAMPVDDRIYSEGLAEYHYDLKVSVLSSKSIVEYMLFETTYVDIALILLTSFDRVCVLYDPIALQQMYIEKETVMEDEHTREHAENNCTHLYFDKGTAHETLIKKLLSKSDKIINI